ncbi:MAG: glycosyltransferase [Acidobacteria bacterium]|nr:glycosyltransferase [Acidobacteriota bacterium]
MTLVYATTARLPTVMAHGLQIAENCAAFAAAGVDVTLLAARRRVGPALGQALGDPRTHYGLDSPYAFDRLPSIDVTGLDVGWSFRLMSVTFGLALRRRLRALPAHAVVYTRDPFVLAVLGRAWPRHKLVLELHQMAESWQGRRLHARAIGSAGLVVAVTAGLEAYARELGAPRTTIAPTGVSDRRLIDPPARDQARTRLGLPHDAFVVGYAGRLQTLGMSKGVDLLVDAAARLTDVPTTLAVVGGPSDMVDGLRRRWLAGGLPGERFVAPGQVPPADVPTWLAAFDVGTLPFPDTRHFAECASPLKLFEYLAAGLPVVASRLPSLIEPMADGRAALFVEADDAAAMATALATLYRDPARRARMGEASRALAQSHRLSTRAERILAAIGAADEPR